MIRGVFDRIRGAQTEAPKAPEKPVEADQFEAVAPEVELPPPPPTSSETQLAQTKVFVSKQELDRKNIELEMAKSRLEILQERFADTPEYKKASAEQRRASKELSNFHLLQNMSLEDRDKEKQYVSAQLDKLIQDPAKNQSRIAELQAWKKSLDAIYRTSDEDVKRLESIWNDRKVITEDAHENIQRLKEGLENPNLRLTDRKRLRFQLKAILIKRIDEIDKQNPSPESELAFFRKHLEGDLCENDHEIQLVEALLTANTTLKEASVGREKGAENIDEAADEVDRLSEEVSRLEVKANAAKHELNLRRYQDLASAVTAATDLIRKNIIATKEMVSKEENTPNRESDFAEELSRLKDQFLNAMRHLEQFEHDKNVEYNGADPYPQKSYAKGAFDWVKSFVVRPEDKRVSKTDLMLQYHLALNGMSGVLQAYPAAVVAAAQATPLSWDDVKSKFSKENFEATKKQFENLALKRPSIARELAANLMHTYMILYPTDTSFLSIARNALQRKTAENVASDMLLGTRTNLMSKESMDAMTPTEIAFVDLASRAPYLAGAYAAATGNSVSGSWANSLVSFIPVVGSYEPLRRAISAAVGVAQVEAEKQLAAKMTRDQEVYVNALLIGYKKLKTGDFKGAATATGQYVLQRELLRKGGGFLRDAVESGVQKAASNRVEELKPQSKPEAAAQLGAASVAVYVASVTAVSAGGAMAWPILAGLGAAVAGVSAVSKMADWMYPERVAQREQKATQDRLDVVGRDLLERAAKRLTKADYEQIGKLAPGERDAEIKTRLEAKLDDVYLENCIPAAAVLRGETQIKMIEALAESNLERIQQLLPPQDSQNTHEKALSAELEKELKTQGSISPQSFGRLTKLIHALPARPATVPEDETHTKMLNLVNQAQPDLTAIQRLLPPEDSRDAVEKELFNGLEELKTQSPISRESLGKLIKEIYTLRVRQFERAAASVLSARS